MSLSHQGDVETTEDSVETLTVGTPSLSDTRLSILTTNDLEQLPPPSYNLQFSTDMDTTGMDEDLMKTEDELQVMQSEIGTHEVEIETSPEQILPDVKTKLSVPPLRPLSIGPKPTDTPTTFKKPAAGRQLLFLRVGKPGQPNKLLSTQGSGLRVANLSHVIFNSTKKKISANTMTVIRPKQAIIKEEVTQPQNVIGDTKNLVVTDKVEAPLKNTQGNIVSPSKPRIITLAQAQKIGLLSGAKLVTEEVAKHVIALHKNKTIKIVPPTKPQPKILPAPQTSCGNTLGQRIILKPSNSNSLKAPAQIIQVTGSQPLSTGQLHEIQIPGKGIVTPTTISKSGISNSSASGYIASQYTFQTPASASNIPLLSTTTSATPTKAGNMIIESAGKTSIAPQLIKPSNISDPGRLVMLPASYLSQPVVTSAKVAIPALPRSVETRLVSDTGTSMVESNGRRRRKQCNCSKSQCLKLYCECFSNGEFCYLCNCTNCANNLENEEHRQQAIKSRLKRNPKAFRPKIENGKDIGNYRIRKHTKGCYCKRSGCVKNYCECYEAQIPCTSNCKCLGCHNAKSSVPKNQPITTANPYLTIPISTPLNSTLSCSTNQIRPKRNSNDRPAASFMTDDVIEATTRCLLTVARDAEVKRQDTQTAQLRIIQEFGNCLQEIIECAKNPDTYNADN